MPNLFITILENIFKHGDVQNEEIPVKITIDISDVNIHFYSINKKKRGYFKEKSTGIGVKNIDSRLKALYSDHFLFEVKDDLETYAVTIQVPSSC